MAIHPDPSFPLLPTDQAEVIRIYLDLMRERYPSEPALEVTTNQPKSSRKSLPRRWHPGEMPGFD